MKDLSFAKVMILLCILGSGVLAWFDWRYYQEIRRVKQALRPNGEVEVLVRQTQQRGKEYAQLNKILSGDELQDQDRPQTYISAIADRDKIDIGQVDINANDRAGRGTVDHVYSISPSDRGRAFSRMSIANFLFSLEDNSRRIRVTKLKIDQLNSDNPPRARPKPMEFPSDSYNFSAEVTSRERAD